MKSYTRDKSDKQILKKIKETLDNLENVNISNALKAEAVLLNIKSLEIKNELEENQ